MSSAFHRPTFAHAADTVFVKDVTPCKAFDMYGYSVGWSPFLKIRLYNPLHIYKCADLLLAGAVTGQPMQPYESHISFILSFLADYNLYGCSWLEVNDSGLIERRGSAVSVYQGREFDTSVECILNSQYVNHEKRHTQVFETQSKEISISSLSEVREADAEFRLRSNMKPWHSQNLQPHYQQVAQSWPWERRREQQRMLQQRILDNGKQESENHTKFKVHSLPTAAELVPSTPCKAHKAVSFASELSEEWILSQEDEKDNSALVQSDEVEAPVEAPAAKRRKNDKELFALFDQLSQSDSSMLASAGDSSLPNVALSFDTEGSSCFQFAFSSPTFSDVQKTNGVTTFTPLHFSNGEDVSKIPLKYGGQEFLVKTLNPPDLEPFDLPPEPAFERLDTHLFRERNKRTGRDTKKLKLELLQPSPSTNDVEQWLNERESSSLPKLSSSTGEYQFASLESRSDISDELLTCVIEVHACTKSGKVPKSSENPISAVFWHISGTADDTDNHGVITTSSLYSTDVHSIVVVESERQLLEEVIKMVRYFNPDILTGFETNISSWAYARSRYKQVFPEHGDTFFDELSRVKVAPRGAWRRFAMNSAAGASDSATGGAGAGTKTGAGSKNTAECDTIKGRYLLSLWNILRKEVMLSKYTLEYVVYHTLHCRIPHFDYDDLTSWWNSNDPAAMNTVVHYWSQRTYLVLKLLAHFEIINRTCERSRIIGIDFLSSLTRGSQFQVEAVMCRLARRENYVLISPSKAQVGQQNALEYIPLVMEPQSRFYTDPVCVLDFRSLYPSIVIAFNLCYSTCIGRVDLWRGRNKLGIKHDLKLSQGLLSRIGEENIYIAPNGMGYVTPKVRKSLLAQMLGEILDTRFMINETRKKTSGNERLQRNLNSKQLALKFIANVTYGYTSASFSGRMPCAELADSIVLAGREILQWSIRKIESTKKWGVDAQVVYGDTDSLFVRLPNVSRTQAFVIGREIADMITAETPDPIMLELEKVYSPCILLTKKRYVGHSYDHEHQQVPFFDAKGTETIRRDGTPIVQKIEKRALQILFDTSDLSKVKSYLYNRWRGILSGVGVNVQDFCFAQEVKLGHYKTGTGTSNLPGGAIVSMKKMLKDDGVEPQYRERVPFVISAGPNGSRINDRAVSPEEMMRSPHLIIDSEYYIQKVIIPPLERLFNLLGANIRDWYAKMPRTIRLTAPIIDSDMEAKNRAANSGTLHGFLKSEMCVSCLENRRKSPNELLCSTCSQNQPRSRYILTSRSYLQEQKLAAALSTCHICSGHLPLSTVHGPRTYPCQSMDCPIFYERESASSEAENSRRLINALF